MRKIHSVDISCWIQLDNVTLVTHRRIVGSSSNCCTSYSVLRTIEVWAQSKRAGWQSSPWKDDVVAPWFINADEFYVRFPRQRLNFGCVITDKDNEKCDFEDGRFTLLTLPPDYVLLHEGSPELDKNKVTLETAQSGTKSLIFIHDFCIMVHAVTFNTSGKVKGNITFDNNVHVEGMGRQIPNQNKGLIDIFMTCTWACFNWLTE
jgi:hypothetical protein